jgi:hypothetical protein
MSTENKEAGKGTCFVVMGFGKKTDFETGRTLDLDKSYRNMIKPAVEAAGLTCIRADEIVHSGMIDVPMYEQLLKADIVVADLSTSNKNAFYELGVRHALRPFTTIVIAEDGIKTFPFDVNHVVIRQYHHLGEDIGFDEVMRFREQLTKSINEILNKDPRESDSPVYQLLRDLTPPALAAAMQAAVQQTAGSAEEMKTAPPPKTEEQTAITHSLLMQQVDEAQKKGDWVAAKSLLNVALQLKGNEQQKDPYLLQRLALITYKSKHPTENQALEEARLILLPLTPGTSNDTETLGLWGAIHKRLWQLSQKKEFLDEAIRAYERGFYLRHDYYNGINFAFLLNERARALTDPAWAIADYMLAQRIRQEVLAICEQWLQNNPEPKAADTKDPALNEYRNSRYWVEATMAEAQIGLENEEKGAAILHNAYEKAPESWMQESTESQIKKLRALLADPPTQFIQPALQTSSTN